MVEASKSTVEDSTEHMREYFSKFVRQEFGRDEWRKIIRFLNYKEDHHPGRRSPRQPKDMSPSADAEKLWMAHGRHMAVVAMRTAVILDILEVSGEVRKDAVTAAMIHDVTKPDEIQNRPQEGVSWDYYAGVSRRGKALMESEGFGDRVIRLSGAMGHESLAETREKLAEHDLDDETLAWFAIHAVAEHDLDDETLAWFAIHAVDDWTVGDQWATTGIFEERMKKNRNNPQITALGKEGYAQLGMNTWEAQEEIGGQVLDLLAERISEKTGDSVTGGNLPVYVDNIIKRELYNCRKIL